VRTSIRAATAALLLAATTAVGAVTAQPATASETGGGTVSASACTTRVILPTAVRIDRPYREVKVTLATSCPDIEYASTDLYGPEGWDDIFIWDPASNGAVEYWDVYDWQTLGAFKTRDGRAYDSNYDDLPFTEGTTSIRLASRAGIQTSRSGSYVTVRASVQRYSPTYSAYRAWNTKARVDEQTSTGWKYLRTLDLGADGVAATKFYSPGAKTYRIRVASTANTWGVTSATSRR
jgi:hypothetical protein